jgi:hypothetical protein
MIAGARVSGRISSESEMLFSFWGRHQVNVLVDLVTSKVHGSAA